MLTVGTPSLPTMLIWPVEVMVTPADWPVTESTGIGLLGSLPGGGWMPSEPCRKFARSLSVEVFVTVKVCAVSVLPPLVPVKLSVPVAEKTFS